MERDKHFTREIKLTFPGFLSVILKYTFVCAKWQI